MDVRTYLQEIRSCDIMISNRRETILRLREEAQNISSGIVDGIRVSGSKCNSRQEELICEYLQMEQQLEDEIIQLRLRKMEAIRLFELLPIAFYDILYKVNILGYTLQDVSNSVDKSYSWATTTQSRALKALQTLLDDKTE